MTSNGSTAFHAISFASAVPKTHVATQVFQEKGFLIFPTIRWFWIVFQNALFRCVLDAFNGSNRRLPLIRLGNVTFSHSV